jgi:hypothetical protein
MLKPKSHKLSFKEFEDREDERITIIVEDEFGIKIIKKRKRIYTFLNGVNLTQKEFQINMLNFKEVITWENNKGSQKKEVNFSWATDILITKENFFELMRAGRARWKDENEIFNTLKNQGYHLEHNYGHGKENLAANFAIFANLAFLIDQIEELSCPLYQKARETMRTKYGLWDRIRVMIQILKFDSWTELINAIAFNIQAKLINTS